MLPEAVRSLRGVMIACGAFSAPRNEQQSRGELGWVSHFAEGVMGLPVMIQKERDKELIEPWPRHVHQQLVAELTPLAEVLRVAAGLTHPESSQPGVGAGDFLTRKKESLYGRLTNEKFRGESAPR